MQFRLVYADSRGEIKVHGELAALGRNGAELWQPRDEEMVPLPAAADLFHLPGCLPIGLNTESGEAEVLTEDDGQPAAAVAASLPIGYTRLLLPAWERLCEEQLPLYGYTAVAAGEDGRLYAAALPTEVSVKWDPFQYPRGIVETLIAKRQAEFPGNRLIEQLAYCSLEYRCLTAQNIFFRRWEGGIPVAKACNARCMGCISEQPADCCPSPQRRVDFQPEIREIVEPAVAHLEEAAEGIVSFGQGCEGEPLTAGELLSDAVREIRRRTAKGTININTNAGLTGRLEELIRAGLDAVRVSLLSACREDYERYHRPQGYNLDDVRESLRICRQAGLTTSINLLVFPGFTDRPEQWAGLRELLAEGCVDRVQLRNLNIDPELFLQKFGGGEAMGLTVWLESLRRDFPEIAVGCFTHPRR